MSGWQPTDEAAARRYRRVALVAIAAFVVIVAVASLIVDQLSAALD